MDRSSRRRRSALRASTCRSDDGRSAYGRRSWYGRAGWRTGVAGDSLTPVEDLDGLVGDADIDEFTDQAVGSGIPMAIDLDVVVGRDAATLPARKDVGLVGQRSQPGTIDLGKQFGPAGAETAHLAGIEFDDETADSGI